MVKCLKVSVSKFSFPQFAQRIFLLRDQYLFFRRYHHRTVFLPGLVQETSEPAAKPKTFKRNILQCPDAICQKGKDCNDNDSVPGFPGVKPCGGECIVAAHGTVYGKMPDRQGIKIIVSAVRAAHLFVLLTLKQLSF
jgi:hypothetical protein